MEKIVNFIFNNKSSFAGILGIIGTFSLLKSYFNGPDAKKEDLTGKVIIVTGASDGIGIPTATDLLKQGAKVIFACRNEKKTLELIGTLDKKYQENAIFMQLDLSDFTSVKNFADKFKTEIGKLDILVNNAGLVSPNFTMTKNNIEQTFQVNTFSPMILTQELLPLLNESKGRVVHVASKSHTRVTYSADLIKNVWKKEGWNFYKDNFGFYLQYAYSKLGNVFFNQFLHEYIVQQKLNVETVALHPGTIHSAIARDAPFHLRLLGYLVYPLFYLVTKSLVKGAQTTLHLCFSKNVKSGEYYKDCDITPVHYYADIKETENRTTYIEWAREQINNNGKDIGVEFKLKLN